jgi:pimeloyl-ACP methyl ester carboxylesterase
MLHGIFGAGRNWASIARGVVARRSDWGVVLVDLRGHGRSPAPPGPHDLNAAAADVRQLVAALDRPTWAVLGHSFGGKVAMTLGQGDPSPQRLFVIDASPGIKPPGGSAWQMLQRVRSLPGTFDSRSSAATLLRQSGLNDAEAQWMGTNLEPVDDSGRLRWRFDLHAIDAMLGSFFQTDLWPALEASQGVPVDLVKAQDADVVTEDDCRRAQQATRVTLHRMAGGHWLHVDNPQAIVDLLVQRL